MSFESSGTDPESFDDNAWFSQDAHLPPKKSALQQWWDNVCKWWDEFCESCSELWTRVQLSFKKNDNSHGYVGLLNANDDADWFDPAGSEDAVSSSYEKVSEMPVARVVDVTDTVQPSFSTATLAAAQNSEESVKPVTLYRAGIGCWALAGFTSMIALGTGIYPLLAIAGMLAVLGTALLITAYYLNDEKKDGSLSDQAFPKESYVIPSYGYGI